MLSKRFLACAAGLLVGGVTLAAIAPLQGMTPEPTQEHKIVTQSAGFYEGTISMWMPGADAPLESPCTENVSTIGDFWVTSLFEMDFMGMPFTGSSSMGYDPEKEKFVGTWIDSMTTSLTVMEGEWDAEKKAIVMDYESLDHETGGMASMRSVNVPGENGYTLEFFKKDGEEYQLTMRMDMKRKKTVEAGAAK